MNCREFQAQMDTGTARGVEAETHLSECANCRKLQSDSVRLAEMLGALPRVDAPANFNHLLRARISGRNARKAAPFFTGLRPMLHFAAAGMIILCAAFIAYFVFKPGSPTVDLAGGSAPSEQTARVETPDSGPVAGVPFDEPAAKRGDEAEPQPTAGNAVPSRVADQKSAPARRVSRKADIAAVEDSGGSRDLAVSRGETINPPGIGVDLTIPAPSINTTTDLTEIWSLIGIETMADKTPATVKSVRKNSVAARSGGLAGDVINAVNGVDLTGAPLSGSSIKVETLTVSRGGQRKEIKLTDRP